MTYDPIDARSGEQLLELSRKGDRDAFGQLIARYYRNCVRIATSLLRDSSEAEDAVQQALGKAFVHLDQYLGEAEFFAWLLRIVVNECRMLMRSKKRALLFYLDCRFNGRESRPLELPAITNDPENDAIAKNMIQVLRTEIRHIPPLLRQVILLRDIDQLPMPDIADRLGITVPAAKSRLLRARAELRRRVTYRFGHASHIMPSSPAGDIPARSTCVTNRTVYVR